MSKAFAVAGQLVLFALFVALFFAGGVLGLFHADPFGAPRWFVTHPTPLTVRYFVPSGLLLMTILWLVVLGIEAAARKMRTAGMWTTLAYCLALVIGLVAKFGWVTPS
jgi:uncharacterized membrane protein YphA (DoxX/SURF4 family)